MPRLPEAMEAAEEPDMDVGMREAAALWDRRLFRHWYWVKVLTLWTVTLLGLGAAALIGGGAILDVWKTGGERLVEIAWGAVSHGGVAVAGIALWEQWKARRR